MPSNVPLCALQVGAALLCAASVVPAATTAERGHRFERIAVEFQQARVHVPVQAQQQTRRYGPFATMRRANEVANQFRRRGCSAVAFHSGDGYYVNVRC